MRGKVLPLSCIKYVERKNQVWFTHSISTSRHSRPLPCCCCCCLLVFIFSDSKNVLTALPYPTNPHIFLTGATSHKANILFVINPPLPLPPHYHNQQIFFLLAAVDTWHTNSIPEWRVGWWQADRSQLCIGLRVTESVSWRPLLGL